MKYIIQYILHYEVIFYKRFRKFAYENYYKVQELYNADFVEKFEKSLNEGKIKKWK